MDYWPFASSWYRGKVDLEFVAGMHETNRLTSLSLSFYLAGQCSYANAEKSIQAPPTLMNFHSRLAAFALLKSVNI